MKISNLKNIPKTGTSHDPDVMKKSIIKNGEIPKLTTFGEAQLTPGQKVTEHCHPTMYEIFHITSGKAIFNINGTESTVDCGDTIIIEPNEKHFQYNPYSMNATWLYFGIAID
jgi:quercetin dioxygenase-like cupin family protein